MSKKEFDIKALSEAELKVKLNEDKKKLLNLRLRKPTGQLEKPHLLKGLRKEIATLLTEINLRKKQSTQAVVEAK